MSKNSQPNNTFEQGTICSAVWPIFGRISNLQGKMGQRHGQLRTLLELLANSKQSRTFSKILGLMRHYPEKSNGASYSLVIFRRKEKKIYKDRHEKARTRLKKEIHNNY